MVLIERSRQMTALTVIRPLPSSADGSHSYEDFLKGGNDLFSRRMCYKVLQDSVCNGVVKAVTERQH